MLKIQLLTSMRQTNSDSTCSLLPQTQKNPRLLSYTPSQLENTILFGVYLKQLRTLAHD